MHAVPCTINIAAPNALEAHPDIAANLRPQLFHLVGERSCRPGTQVRDRSERPLVPRPIVRGEQLNAVSGIDNSAPEPLQISFRAAGGGIAAAHEADGESFLRHLNDLQLYLLTFRQNSYNLMPGETLNAPSPSRSTSPAPCVLPTHLLYSIFARIGGSGLDTDAFETLRASYRGGFLGKAIAYDNRQKEIPASLIYSLRWHPVRLISFLDRPYYYGAKKKYLDWIASRHLTNGRYDLCHSWSGDCLQSLRVAKQRRIPSIVEIPTWHRDRGRLKTDESSGTGSRSSTPWFRRGKR